MNSKKIVIVDDDVAILDSLGIMLDFEGFEVNAFERGSEIFTYVESVSKPDIILLDMWLSGEDGRDICKKLKEIYNLEKIPVSFLKEENSVKKVRKM